MCTEAASSDALRCWSWRSLRSTHVWCFFLAGELPVEGKDDFEMPLRLRRAVIANVRRHRDWKASEHGVCAIDGVIDDGATTDPFSRPHSSIKSSWRRPHPNLGLPKNNILIFHLRHAHASKQGLESGKQFECFACDAAKFPTSSANHIRLECRLI